MPILPIHTLQDTRLEPYRDVRERDLAQRHDLFLAEGRVVLDSLLNHGRFHLDSLLISDKRLPHDHDLLARLDPDTPVYVLSSQMMNQVVGFDIHRGLLAAGRRPAPLRADQLLAQIPDGPSTVLVLEALTNHDNVGACFRNAAAFGASALLLDERCCDPLYRKAIRVSAGHALALPFNNPGQPSAELIRALHDAGFTTIALTLAPDALRLAQMTRPAERIAIVLGTEGKGLSQETTRLSNLRVKMEMAPGVDSLNVATAGAVALFALK